MNDIGPIVAESVYDFVRDPENAALLDRLAIAGVRMDEGRVAARGGVLDGLSIVVTGSFAIRPRSELEELIKSLGGKVSGAVSKKTSFVVSGEGGGSKRDKAETLGVEIIDEQELFDRLRGFGWTDAPA